MQEPEPVKKVKRIPLGVVLLTIGTIVTFAASLIWFAARMTGPTDIVEIADRLIRTASDLDSLLDGGKSEGILAVLMPESPAVAPTPLPLTQLPSHSAAADAPTSLGTGYHSMPATMPIRLVIPSLDIDAPVRPVRPVAVRLNGQRMLQWEVPNLLEAGWHQISAPLGQPGNTVLNGHNNVHGEIFRDLVDLEVGEQITLYDARQAYRYEIVQSELLPENDQPLAVRLQNARYIEPTKDERVTIVSCWPYATNNYRVIVVAKPVDVDLSP